MNFEARALRVWRKLMWQCTEGNFSIPLLLEVFPLYLPANECIVCDEVKWSWLLQNTIYFIHLLSKWLALSWKFNQRPGHQLQDPCSAGVLHWVKTVFSHLSCAQRMISQNVVDLFFHSARFLSIFFHSISFLDHKGKWNCKHFSPQFESLRDVATELSWSRASFHVALASRKRTVLPSRGLEATLSFFHPRARNSIFNMHFDVSMMKKSSIMPAKRTGFYEQASSYELWFGKKWHCAV